MKIRTHHMACTETGLKMCCRPQTLTLKPLLSDAKNKQEFTIRSSSKINSACLLMDHLIIIIISTQIFRDRKKILHIPIANIIFAHDSTHPSPSSLMAVSASTLSTKPTVVFSLQSMPSRHDSSISFDELRLQLLPTFDSVSHWLSSARGH